MKVKKLRRPLPSTPKPKPEAGLFFAFGVRVPAGEDPRIIFGTPGQGDSDPAAKR
jgi:hypothetical protein